jgi:hypothetical protein
MGALTKGDIGLPQYRSDCLKDAHNCEFAWWGMLNVTAKRTLAWLASIATLHFLSKACGEDPSGFESRQGDL